MISLDAPAEEVARLPYEEFLEWNRAWTDRFCDQDSMRWHERCGTDEVALALFHDWQTFARFAFQNPLAAEFAEKERVHFQAMLVHLIERRDNGFKTLKATTAALDFAADKIGVCRIGNQGWPRHLDGPDGTCRRCGAVAPKISKP